jgi:tRNA-(ms[2]io[6]A)-hydroxylase
MSTAELMQPIYSFLSCRTSQAWIDRALEELDIILLDHAANEMKAAQAAMTLMAKNPTKLDVLNKMSRLGREELVHFEQVLKILKKRGIKYQALKACRYAADMAKHIRKGQDDNRVDTLIVGAIIEARSCERFAALAPHLDAELEKFYTSLLKSEARHYQDYLDLAQSYSAEDIQPRVDFFLELERKAIESPDRMFRFHSGIPVVDEPYQRTDI